MDHKIKWLCGTAFRLLNTHGQNMDQKETIFAQDCTFQSKSLGLKHYIFYQKCQHNGFPNTNGHSDSCNIVLVEQQSSTLFTKHLP